jgi:hypothetical protein
MPSRAYQVLGKVINLRDRRGFPGLRVEAWDKDLLVDDLVGSAITDDQGAFRIEFDQTHFQELFLDREPDLFFKVYQAETLLKSTEDAVLWNVKNRETEIKIEVDVEIPSKPKRKSKSMKVLGHVRGADSKPIKGIRVQALDKDLRSEELLGEAKTSRQGAYGISYTAEQYRRAEKGGADLIIRALDAQGSVLAESPILFNTAATVTIDLVVDTAEYRGPSEYEVIISQLSAVRGAVPIASFTADDISFLAGETGLEAGKIGLISTAAAHGEKTGLEPEVFYGFARENLPVGLPALLAHSAESLRAALERAVAANIIPADVTGHLDEILAKLKMLSTQAVLQVPGEENKTALGQLLDLALPEGASQIAFLDLYTAHQGPIEDFWQMLRERPEFGAAGQVEQLQFTLQLAALTSNNPALVRVLLQDPQIKSTRDLTDLDADGWVALIRASSPEPGESIPGYIQGYTPEEKISNYAQFLDGMLQSAFPTVYLAHGLSSAPAIDGELVSRVLDLNGSLDLEQPLPEDLNWGGLEPAEQSEARASLAALQREIRMFPAFDYRQALSAPEGALTNPVRQGIQALFSNDPELDLGKVNLDTYLAENGARALAGIDKAVQGSLTNQLKAMQRVYRVTPRYQALSTLMSQGLDSAYAIAGVSRESFIRDQAMPLGSAAAAGAVYDRAAHTRDTAVLVNSAQIQTHTDTRPAVMQPPQLDPTWRNLFGSLELCDCEHCRSLYSPAAYLVDLLQFLKPGARQALLAIRPDLEHIQLSCENTNTPLPYIDLVNEILESYISHNGPHPSAAHDTLERTAAELTANPQFVDQSAYDILRVQAFYPLSLPFDRSLEMARAYLEQLGTSRLEVMRAFASGGTPSQAQLAAEYLKMPAAEWAILTGRSTASLSQLFGYGASPTWAHEVAGVPVFLERTQVTYEELLAIVETRFINPRRDPAANPVLLFTPGDGCDLEDMLLDHRDCSGLSTEDLGRLYFFIRLWRRLGWAMEEVDLALGAFGTEGMEVLAARGASDVEAILVKIAQAAELHNELDIPLEQLFSFWADMNTRGDRPLYWRLFQNPAVASPPDPYFSLNDDGTELRSYPGNGATPTIAGHMTAILAAARIRSTDLAAILDPQTAPLSLRSLSLVYRMATLARALRLSIPEIKGLAALSGRDPFAQTVPGATDPRPGPEATLSFVRLARRVQQSKFSVDSLFHIYRNEPGPGGDLAPSEETLANFVRDLRAGLSRIAAQTSVPADPRGEILRVRLAAMPGSGETQAQEAISFVEGVPSDTAANHSLADHYFGAFSSGAELYAGTLVATPPADEAARAEYRSAAYAFLLTRLMTTLREQSSRAAIKQLLSGALALSSDTTALLLEELINSGADESKKIIDDFLVLLDPAAGSTEAEAAYRLLHRIAALAGAFRFDAQELAYFSAHGERFDGFDLSGLPRSTSGYRPAFFDQWQRLDDYAALRGDPAGQGQGLLDVFEAATSAEARRCLAEAMHWDVEALEQLAGPGPGLNLRDADFQSEKAIVGLKAAMSLVRRTGTSPLKLADWATRAPDPAQAEEIRNTLKARYDEEQWLLAVKPAHDSLRERQRDALVAYARTRVPAGYAQKLYEYLLIDVDMSTCAPTSRIRQAITTVQLFIQRSLLGYQRGVAASDIDAEVWKWMKNYRVWEANRKVFLYPENWIEPELRDNKSPFFKDLENELLQNDVTQDSAESAFLNYLEKLDQVARLEMCGMFWEKEADPGNAAEQADIMHVFARTQSAPHSYYYRQLVDRASWTPWEKVLVDIEGDHLIPVVWNRRLHIFWPIFTEKSEAQSDPSLPDPSQAPPLKYWEIKLAWSEYRNGKWAQKRLSEAAILTRDHSFRPRERYPMQALFADGDLEIRVFDSPSGWRNVAAPMAAFRFSSPSGSPEIGGAAGGLLFEHSNTDYSYMKLVERTPEVSDQLHLYKLASSPYQPEDLEVLDQTPGTFRLVYPAQYEHFQLQSPLFYEDDSRTFFVTPERVLDMVPQLQVPDRVRPILESRASLEGLVDAARESSGWIPPERLPQTRTVEDAANAVEQPGGGGGSRPLLEDAALEKVYADARPTAPQPERAVWGSISAQDQALFDARGNLIDRDALWRELHTVLQIRFAAFYHPQAGSFIRALNRRGIPGLLTLDNQYAPDAAWSETYFSTLYDPTDIVEPNYPSEDVAFDSSAYALYNWEIFFHAPMLIASQLTRNQRFEEAQRWLHYIFDPTDHSASPGTQRFWKLRPFAENEDAAFDQIGELLLLLSYDGPDPALLARKRDIEHQVHEWREHPFNPHLIARLRLTAYQKAVVMKYIDNLIAWGDSLFAQNRPESVDQATLLYLLAQDILGPRPQALPERKAGPQTYQQLRPHLDAFSNALVSFENAFPLVTSDSPARAGTAATARGLGVGTTFYFCIPRNDHLLAYWDTVQDRLFKIRHCMNIAGAVRQLPLFEPPIDPALLGRAAALGVDLSSALSDISAPLPHYRFTYLIQKVYELVSELKGLGSALLGAIEKKDAEALAVLRTKHETGILRLARLIREQQSAEAQATLESLQRAREVTDLRHHFYATIERLNVEETAHLDQVNLGLGLQGGATQLELIGSLVALIPNFKAGFITTLGVTFGGENVSQALRAFGAYLNSIASIVHTGASLAATLGSYHRRWDEWQLQERTLGKELEQIDKQIVAAQIRVAIAERELANHDRQIEDSEEIEAFLRDKYSNAELYSWMISKTSEVYFQTYQLAYDLARKAERAFRFERGVAASDFIQFGYWDSLRKGLLAGERLQLDLKRMELSYLDQNKREFEITKHISLTQLNPLALVQLRETGTCLVDLPEVIFDLDYPGHYMRRVKSVGLTIPCVSGPFASVNCTLTLMTSSTRLSSALRDGCYARPLNDATEDPRFQDSFGAVESIATSSAQNDSGLFELNFHDERYLPFEGAGVISQWQIELSPHFPGFDYDTISDVILHLRYTARDGGGALKARSSLELQDAVKHVLEETSGTSLARFFSLRHEFPTEWRRMLLSPNAAGDHVQKFVLNKERFPFLFQGKVIEIKRIDLVGQPKRDQAISKLPGLTPPNQEHSIHFGPGLAIGGLCHEVGTLLEPVSASGHGEPLRITVALDAEGAGWELHVASADAQAFLDTVDDILVICGYTIGNRPAE